MPFKLNKITGDLNLGKENTNITPVTAKGGVVRVIDSATGDIARTTTGFIEDEKYGFYFVRDVAAVSGVFSSTDPVTGRLILKCSSTDEIGRYSVDFPNLGGASAQNMTKIIPVKPSTTYKISVPYRSNNRKLDLLFRFLQYDATGTRVSTGGSASVSGTNDLTIITATITTEATAVGAILRFGSVSGNIGYTEYDVNSSDFYIKEVSTITNSSASPALLYPKVTAVTSKDNIDQSMVVKTNSTSIGKLNGYMVSQSLTLSKLKFQAVSLWLQASGTPTDNVLVTVENSSSDNPGGTIYATYSISAASIIAGGAAEYTFLLPFTSAVQKYVVKVTRSGSLDDTNYYVVFRDNLQSYAGGVGKYWTGSIWANLGSLYFKTLYSKNTTNFTVSTDTQTLSVTAPTVDGWADGTIIDTATLGVTPLTLATGSNNIYYSSNGPDTADGTVDSSLQCIVGGVVTKSKDWQLQTDSII